MKFKLNEKIYSEQNILLFKNNWLNNTEFIQYNNFILQYSLFIS